MKNNGYIPTILRICILACLIGLCNGQVLAQRMIRVSGVVYNAAETKRKVPVTDAEVIVYSCKTIAEGEKLKNDLDADNLEVAMFVDPETITRIDHNGYYEILVPDNGALLFKAEMSKSVMVRVNGMMKIDVSIDLGLQLEEVVVTGIRTELQPEPAIGGLLGDKFIVANTFQLPQQMGSDYSRLVIQPYTVMCDGLNNDTIAYNKPIIVDGKEFRNAQLRKMGYDLNRDPLEKFVDKDVALTNDKLDIPWNDTIKVPNPSVNYSCYADFIVENMHTLVYNKNFQIVSCKNKRPMQFLEYSLTYKEMDFFSKFNREKAQIERRNSADKVSLTFEISSAKLVDTKENMENMNKIKQKLQDILNEPGSTLKELYITGYSSPEGSYEKNLELAEKRTNKILNEVVAVLPRSVERALYKMPKAVVKPWTEVVDLLRKDSLNKEADAVQNVIDKYPKDISSQSVAVARLPYYRPTIVKYLEQLRQVEYSIKFEVYREPTDEEVWEVYKKRGINGIYTRYEYWKLFQMIKDDRELEQFALKAYKESGDRPWPLAGNIVAVQYLKRDTFDAKLLEPLVDKTVYVTNYERTNIDTKRREIVNPVEVVNNLLCMYIKAYNYSDASIMAQILPDDKQFDLVKAFAWALGGYYKGGRTKEEVERSKKTFETVKNSSKRNEVIMYLALENKAGNSMAEKSIAELPQDDAMTWYLKAIVTARRGDAGFADTMMNLYQCFMLDKNYIATAKNDGEFTDEVVEEAENMLMF